MFTAMMKQNVQPEMQNFAKSSKKSRNQMSNSNAEMQQFEYG